jgi:hypothetical protein
MQFGRTMLIFASRIRLLQRDQVLRGILKLEVVGSTKKNFNYAEHISSLDTAPMKINANLPMGSINFVKIILLILNTKLKNVLPSSRIVSAIMGADVILFTEMKILLIMNFLH